jgi:hypothetical protein
VPYCHGARLPYWYCAADSELVPPVIKKDRKKWSLL